MGYRNISISDDVYGLLSGLKRKGESYNAFFLRVFGRKEKKKLTDFAGSWDMTDEEWEKIDKNLKKMWRSWDVRLRQRPFG
ncbi:TPA: antitoxin [Candidatus Micrarchaeota archaeon]|nr:antitoxin [Candidatus Micrarchaeota archaeon]